MANKELLITMRAKDMVSKTTKGMSASMRSFAKVSKKGLDATKRAAQIAGKALKAMLGPITLITSALSALSGAAFFSVIKSAAGFGDEVQKMSQRLGLSTELLSELRFQAELSGTDFASAASGYKLLAKNLFDARDGVGLAKDAFDQLGVQASDSEGNLRDIDEVVLQIADSFSIMEDGTEKTALAMKIFGRSGADLIPLLNSGRDGLSAMADDAKRLGIVIGEEAAEKAANFNDQLSTLMAAFRGLKFSFGLAFFDDLASTMRDIAFFVADNRDEIVDLLKKVTEIASNLVESIFKAFGDKKVRGALYDLWVGSMKAIFSAAGQAAGQVFNASLLDVVGTNNFAGRFLMQQMATSAANSKDQVTSELSRLYDRVVKTLGVDVKVSANNTSDDFGNGGEISDLPEVFAEWTEEGKKAAEVVKSGFVAGFREMADNLSSVFQDMTESGRRFADELHGTLSSNFFDLARRGFTDFASFVKDTFANILESILSMLSDALSSQVVSGFSSLLGSIFGGPVGALQPGAAGPTLPTNLGGPAPASAISFSSSAASSAAPTIIINAVDASSVSNLLTQNNGTIANNLVVALANDNSLKTNFKGAIA